MLTLAPDFQEALLIITRKLGSRTYAFRGTTSLVLQGIDMNVDDIDIVCDSKTAVVCNEIFNDYLRTPIRYSEGSQFKSYFGKFNLNNVPCEVMGNWQIKDRKGIWSKQFDGSDRVFVSVEGEQVPVTPVTTELKMFTLMGRWTALQKIQRQFQNQQALPLPIAE